MNILIIEEKELKLNRRHILDWITLPEVQGGINHPKYWIIRTDQHFNNPDNNEDAHKIRHILYQSGLYGYTSVQIKKNDETSS